MTEYTGAFPVNDPSAVKIWSKMVEVAEREYAEIAPLIGKDENAVIHEMEELTKGPGDQVKFTLRSVLNGAGFTEGQVATGNGEALTFSQDHIMINELGHVVGTPSENTIDAQRVPFELRRQGRDALAEWYANRKAVSIFNQLCGYTPANATLGAKFTGLNAVTAPRGGAGLVRHLWAGTATNDQSLTSNDTFTTALIDKAVTRAVLGQQQLKPVMVGGKKKWVMYIHPVQVEQLRTNAGAGGWLDIQKAAMMGGKITGNAIYNGALGEWNNVILRSTQNVTYGVHSGTGAPVTNVRRAVLLGAQAAICAYGKRTNPARNKYRWSEELKDHDRFLEVGVWGIWGCKKSVFRTPNPANPPEMVEVDFGTMVVSTWAPDPT